MDPRALIDVRDDEDRNTLLHHFAIFVSTMLQSVPQNSQIISVLLTHIIGIRKAFPNTEAVHFARNRSGNVPYEMASHRLAKYIMKSVALELVKQKTHIEEINWRDDDDEWEDEDDDEDEVDEEDEDETACSHLHLRPNCECCGGPISPRVSTQTSTGSVRARKKASRRLRVLRPDLQSTREPKQVAGSQAEAEADAAQSRAGGVGRKRSASASASSSKSMVYRSTAPQPQPEQQEAKARVECDECVRMLEAASADTDTTAPLEAVLSLLIVVRASEAHEIETHRPLAKRALETLISICQSRHRDLLAAARIAALNASSPPGAPTHSID